MAVLRRTDPTSLFGSTVVLALIQEVVEIHIEAVSMRKMDSPLICRSVVLTRKRCLS